MNDIIDDSFEPESGCYLEALIRSRQLVKDTVYLADKLDNVISLELDLAVMGAEKAKSEILKRNSDNKIRPIK